MQEDDYNKYVNVLQQKELKISTIINYKSKLLATKLAIDDRIEKMEKYIKKRFPRKLSFRLINPSKADTHTA